MLSNQITEWNVKTVTYVNKLETFEGVLFENFNT